MGKQMLWIMYGVAAACLVGLVMVIYAMDEKVMIVGVVGAVLFFAAPIYGFVRAERWRRANAGEQAHSSAAVRVILAG